MTKETEIIEPILTTQNLNKRFKGKTVVKDVSIQLALGEVVGLLGANGAGKTTTFKMLTGMVKPTQGHIEIGDNDVNKKFSEVRKMIGYCP